MSDRTPEVAYCPDGNAAYTRASVFMVQANNFETTLPELSDAYRKAAQAIDSALDTCKLKNCDLGVLRPPMSQDDFRCPIAPSLAGALKMQDKRIAQANDRESEREQQEQQSRPRPPRSDRPPDQLPQGTGKCELAQWLLKRRDTVSIQMSNALRAGDVGRERKVNLLRLHSILVGSVAVVSACPGCNLLSTGDGPMVPPDVPFVVGNTVCQSETKLRDIIKRQPQPPELPGPYRPDRGPI